MQQQLGQIEIERRAIGAHITPKRKAALGQFMTPASVAGFMASLFPSSTLPTCRLLDAGAGLGALSCAFLDRWVAGEFGFESVEATAYEIDPDLRDHLARHLAGYSRVTPRIVLGDYIKLASAKGLRNQGYTHVILNPPYRKINSCSDHRLALRSVGIETVNLYSAFVALAIGETAPGGQIIAILPRSFCNGPYYRSFRDFILERTALCHIHLFKSRDKAFKDDAVLQENVIIRLERDGLQGPVTISTSTDDTFSDLGTCKYPFEQIVFPDDPERFIHVPTATEQSATGLSSIANRTLADIGVQVSTGPVVDFRVKAHLRNMPEPGCAPLIYPGHLTETGAVWPMQAFKKSNAIMRNSETEKWLYPNGFYCVTRRFSSKEEKRRVRATVINPAVFNGYMMLGFENHLNVFHENKHGMPEALAHGLALFLNTTIVDEYFRRFSGHTQVNATDLKLMKYPSRAALLQLGQWAMQQEMLTQQQIDEKVKALMT